MGGSPVVPVIHDMLNGLHSFCKTKRNSNVMCVTGVSPMFIPFQPRPYSLLTIIILFITVKRSCLCCTTPDLPYSLRNPLISIANSSLSITKVKQFDYWHISLVVQTTSLKSQSHFLHLKRHSDNKPNDRTFVWKLKLFTLPTFFQKGLY